MQKAFEKIVERLDKASDYYECDEQGREHVQMVDLSEAIDIVNQVAEEYKTATSNDLMVLASLPSLYPMMQDFEVEAIQRVVESANDDGWIPCSSGRLPAEGEIYEVTATFSNGTTYTEFAYYDYEREEWWKYDESGRVNVLAWRKHLETYQPKGE